MDYSSDELMACVFARALRDGDTIVMGTNAHIPAAAWRLARPRGGIPRGGITPGGGIPGGGIPRGGIMPGGGIPGGGIPGTNPLCAATDGCMNEADGPPIPATGPAKPLGAAPIGALGRPLPAALPMPGPPIPKSLS